MASSLRLAADNPVARVLPLLDVPHLDRGFDYSVPVELADDAQPGTRVRVTFHGRQVDGYLLERRTDSEYPGELTPLRRVISPHRVLTGSFRELVEWTARRYAGTVADVIRLAIPPRVSRIDKEDLPTPRAVDSTTSINSELGLPKESQRAWARYLSLIHI